MKFSAMRYIVMPVLFSGFALTSVVAQNGFCVMEYYRQHPVMNDRTTLYIDDLCVLEECRGKHIGSAIYQHILRYAKQRGCYNVTLNVWACNESAMKFYESMGLKPQKVGMETIL